MASHSAFAFGCLLLYTVGTLVLAETGCPPPEDIAPCICRIESVFRVFLECSNIDDSGTLARVFENSERYTFLEVRLRSVAAHHLPSEILEKPHVYELYLENCNFSFLFSGTPKTNTLEKLQLDNVTLLHGFLLNDALKPVTSLKTLIVNGVKAVSPGGGMRWLDEKFCEVLPSSLKKIILTRTGIKRIRRDVFSCFPNLDKLEVSSSRLSALTRNMFPRPFNIRFLYFENNNISYIPEDLFTDMPKLHVLSMKNNYISEIPEAAFDYTPEFIPFLRFDGNPLRCNCSLVWLIRNKPEIILGTCHSPSNLRGKHLEELLPGDFNCH